MEQNEDLKELMELAAGGGWGDMYWQLMTDAALAVQNHIDALEKKANMLEALSIAGVDNWTGFSHAFDVAEEYGLEIE